MEERHLRRNFWKKQCLQKYLLIFKKWRKKPVCLDRTSKMWQTEWNWNADYKFCSSDIVERTRSMWARICEATRLRASARSPSSWKVRLFLWPLKNMKNLLKHEENCFRIFCKITTLINNEKKLNQNTEICFSTKGMARSRVNSANSPSINFTITRSFRSLKQFTFKNRSKEQFLTR